MDPCYVCNEPVYRSSSLCKGCWASRAWGLLNGIDWDLLRAQKSALLEVLEHSDEMGWEDRSKGLQGILHLLDAVQDHAADYMLSDDVVFGGHDE